MENQVESLCEHIRTNIPEHTTGMLKFSKDKTLEEFWLECPDPFWLMLVAVERATSNNGWPAKGWPSPGSLINTTRNIVFAAVNRFCSRYETTRDFAEDLLRFNKSKHVSVEILQDEANTHALRIGDSNWYEDKSPEGLQLAASKFTLFACISWSRSREYLAFVAQAVDEIARAYGYAETEQDFDKARREMAEKLRILLNIQPGALR